MLGSCAITYERLARGRLCPTPRQTRSACIAGQRSSGGPSDQLLTMFMAGQEQLLAGMSRQNALLEEIADGQKELRNLIKEDGGLGSGAAAAATSAKKT